MLYSPPRFAAAADAVAYREGPEGDLQVLLIQRLNSPYAGSWALPGGFVEEDEDLPEAMKRELKEETGLEPRFYFQLGAWGKPGRDPRGRVISAEYLAVAGPDAAEAKGADDARCARWWPVDNLPELAFDHHDVASFAMRRLRRECERTQLIFAFLPQESTLSRLCTLLNSVGVSGPAEAAEKLVEHAPDVSKQSRKSFLCSDGISYSGILERPVFMFSKELI